MTESEVTIRRAQNGYVVLYYGDVMSGTSEVYVDFEDVIKAAREFMHEPWKREQNTDS